jgi:hypothetical protein
MTIRITPPVTPLDDKRLAAVVTSALVNSTSDEHHRPRRQGTGWIAWGDAQSVPDTTAKLD